MLRFFVKYALYWQLLKFMNFFVTLVLNHIGAVQELTAKFMQATGEALSVYAGLYYFIILLHLGIF